MSMITQELMNRIVMVVGNQHNSHNKLNAGELREYIRLILNAFATEILGETHMKHLTGETQMPAKKKASAKKAKPAAKPMPKKGK